MRGTDTKQSSMLCLMSPESLVPAQHPIRAMKKLADAALGELGPVFESMDSALALQMIADRIEGPSTSRSVETRAATRAASLRDAVRSTSFRTSHSM